MTTLTLDKPELVDRLEQIAIDRKTTSTALLDAAVLEFIEKMEQQVPIKPPGQPAVAPEFLQEVAAFERLKPQLLQQYAGRVVAIYQGSVVGVGDDVLAVHNAVIEKYGPVHCYVEWVEKETPRRVRIASAWRKR
jgi:hypothetical protein